MVSVVWMSGCAIGVLTQVFHNSIMRVPATRWPWMHVALGVSGGYALEWYDTKVEWAQKMVQERQKEDVEKNIRF
jgi:hypothetical protein